MVRIKFTGPVSTVRPQDDQVRADLASNGSASTPSPTGEVQSVVHGHSKMAVQESQLVQQQQQSLEMVKIMLHVSFGTLFYLRELLPLPCFDDRDLKEIQRQQKFTYQEFINNDSVSDPSKGDSVAAVGRGKRGQPLKVILRGSDPKADMIVDVLEMGIFEALSKRVLEAIQMTVIVDKEAPDNVVESYTFSFKYTGGLGEISRRLESLSIKPFGYVVDMKSAQTARVGLETIVRRLITLSAFLPTLPNKRSLGIHLFYTDDCPPDYEPPGFTGAKDGSITYPLTENWRKESQTCGAMDSGWHTVGLKVTSLKWVGAEPEGMGSLPQIPLDIEYKDTVPRTDDIGFDNEETMLQNSKSEGGSHEATQDAIERERLRMMMPSQEIASPDSDLVPTQPIKPTTTLEAENVETASLYQRFSLSRRKIADIRKNVDSRTSGTMKDPEIQNPVTVRCECEWPGEEEAMIECSFCRTRQHLLCYGYQGMDDPRVPDVHACYRCLSEPSEIQVLAELKKLVLARRALRIILNEGFPNMTSVFAEKLHCSTPTILQLTNLLRKEGFLQPTLGYKAKGFPRKGLPKFSIPESQDVRQRIQRDILDPMVKIKHHYTKQYPHDSLEALSPPATATSEANDTSKPNSQDKDISMRSYETNESGTPNSDDKPTSSLQRTHSLRKRTLQSNGHSITRTDDRNNPVPSTQLPKPGNIDNKVAPELRSNRKRTRSSQIDPEPHAITPSQSTAGPGSLGEGVRRSARKRRKISNYSKLIDVGAETSGNEHA